MPRCRVMSSYAGLIISNVVRSHLVVYEDMPPPVTEVSAAEAFLGKGHICGIPEKDRARDLHIDMLNIRCPWPCT